MNEDITRDILRRLAALERTSARLRIGEVTGTSPLDVALGGSSTSYEDVQAIGPLADGDLVASVLWGNDLLVLGALGRGMRLGTDSVTFTASATSATTAVSHGLGSTPTAVFTQWIDANIDGHAVTSPDATTFSVTARYVSAVTGTSFFYWLAIG